MTYRHQDHPHIVMQLTTGRLDAECEGCGAKKVLKFSLNEENATMITQRFRETVKTWKAEHSKCKRTVH